MTAVGGGRRPATPPSTSRAIVNQNLPDVHVKIRVPHWDLGEDDYHLWVTFGERVAADRLGRMQPSITYKHWTRWICNNPDCQGQVIVHDDAVRALIGASS